MIRATPEPWPSADQAIFTSSRQGWVVGQVRVIAKHVIGALVNL